LAFRVMLDEEGSEKFKLVHGYARNTIDSPYFTHAWIELSSSEIYDPVLDKYIMVPHWRYRPVRRYSKKQAMKLAVKHNFSRGPWDKELKIANAQEAEGGWVAA